MSKVFAHQNKEEATKWKSLACPCGGIAVYFGEALFGSYKCDKCKESLGGIGRSFLKTINARWLAGERGHVEDDDE